MKRRRMIGHLSLLLLVLFVLVLIFSWRDAARHHTDDVREAAKTNQAASDRSRSGSSKTGSLVDSSKRAVGSMRVPSIAVNGWGHGLGEEAEILIAWSMSRFAWSDLADTETCYALYASIHRRYSELAKPWRDRLEQMRSDIEKMLTEGGSPAREVFQVLKAGDDPEVVVVLRGEFPLYESRVQVVGNSQGDDTQDAELVKLRDEIVRLKKERSEICFPEQVWANQKGKLYFIEPESFPEYVRVVRALHELERQKEGELEELYQKFSR